MTIDIENARRFNEEPAIKAVSSKSDIVLVRLADGTGVKALPIGAIRAFIAGDVTALKTKDKDSLVAAINELVGADAAQVKEINALKNIVANYSGAGVHNSIYRGKSLGTALSSAQAAAIHAGTFDDMYIGDYWTINGVTYRIAAFDYYLRTGDASCTKHHVTLVPDTALNQAQMNTSDVVTGAYVGSAMYKANLATAKNTISAAFSPHVLSHRQYLKNAVTNGYESGGAWYDSTVELMTEQNVYGGKIFANCVHGTNFAQQHTIDRSQYPLFALDPTKIAATGGYWLRDVTASTSFAYVNRHDLASSSGAATSYGVRPAFSIS